MYATYPLIILYLYYLLPSLTMSKDLLTQPGPPSAVFILTTPQYLFHHYRHFI